MKSSAPGRRRGAYAQTERVLALRTRLAARRAPSRLDALAEELGVSVKQLRRDLAVLDGAGHPIELVRLEGRAAVRLARSRAEPIPLTLRERFALLAMRDVFAALEGTPLAEDARSIFDKVAATLPAESAEDLAALGPRFRFVPDGGIKAYAEHADVIDALLTGALRRQAVQADYVPSRGQRRRGLFEPWGLALYRNGLYAVGCWRRPGKPSGSDETPRVHAVERFRRAEHRREERFVVPPSFSLGAYFAGAFGIFPGGVAEPLSLLFDPAVAPLVTGRRYHGSQTTRRVAGGGVRMKLRLPISPEVVSWLVGWGPRVEVEAPAALRAQVLAEHAAACRAAER